MKTFIAALALASVLAFPAFAQSYDPDIGSGNIARWSESTISTPSVLQRGGVGGSARVIPGGSATSAFAAVTPFGTPAGGNHASSERDTALRDCSAVARRFLQSTWGTLEIQQHRACMTQHGQPE